MPPLPSPVPVAPSLELPAGALCSPGSSTPRRRFDPGATVVEAQGEERQPEALGAPPFYVHCRRSPSLLLLLHRQEGLGCSSTLGSASKQLQRMARLSVSK